MKLSNKHLQYFFFDSSFLSHIHLYHLIFQHQFLMIIFALHFHCLVIIKINKRKLVFFKNSQVISHYLKYSYIKAVFQKTLIIQCCVLYYYYKIILNTSPAVRIFYSHELVRLDFGFGHRTACLVEYRWFFEIQRHLL